MKALRNCIGILVICTFTQCAQNDPDYGSGPYMQVSDLAGTNPSKDWNFLPYPAHFGEFEGYPTFLLSKANRPGPERSIIPIGLIKFEARGNEMTWMVANDAHPKFQIEQLRDIKDLMTTHNGIKSTLERWIVNHQGIGTVNLKGWDEVPSDN